MIDQGSIGAIIATYKKHGWILRRVLLSASDTHSAGLPEFAGIPVVRSSIDAAWFSRPPKEGNIAWELRYLGSIPFALLESVDESAPGFEGALRAVEQRLCDAIMAKISA